MRLPALTAALVLAAGGAAGCGRWGYDDATPDTADDDGGDPDAPLAPEPDGGPPGVLATCATAVEVIDFGNTNGASATSFGLDVAPTATGFVVAWSAGNGAIVASGLAVQPGPRLVNIQTASTITNVLAAGTNLSFASLGDDAMLGVDDPVNNRIELYALDERGYERSSAKTIDGHRGYGHAFVTADPGRDRFVVMGSSGAATVSFTRVHDIHPESGPTAAFPVATESAAAELAGGGYALITGNSSNCDIGQFDSAMAPVGAPQPIAMTCHHASVVAAPGSTKVVAGWNCDNDAVWTTGGELSGTLPAFHALYGDASNSASNPRLATTSAGVWFAFQVGTDRLGHALLDADSNPVTGGAAAIDHTSAALKAYDLASHGDIPFLFWLDVTATSTKLMAMKLCPP